MLESSFDPKPFRSEPVLYASIMLRQHNFIPRNNLPLPFVSIFPPQIKTFIQPHSRKQNAPQSSLSPNRPREQTKLFKGSSSHAMISPPVCTQDPSRNRFCRIFQGKSLLTVTQQCRNNHTLVVISE